ncbi:hypothetical protein KC19_9G141500 [Ceratodon purpureus]|uniref:40S ribosomal protein S4 n=1 Tax=Ceratodon purpureus TaxID=3225 RepID=A0A8T0GVM3_CERPU|nr:hypothetical protein KC19_9G141500 [Ceratodon purpureus]
MLDKLGGAFAPKPSPGPHKERECLPLVVMLRNRLKYALTYREVVAIVMQRLISIDGKVRTDKCYPAGFMDVISIAKTNENFRLLYDNKGRFTLHHISAEEAKVCNSERPWMRDGCPLNGSFRVLSHSVLVGVLLLWLKYGSGPHIGGSRGRECGT